MTESEYHTAPIGRTFRARVALAAGFLLCITSTAGAAPERYSSWWLPNAATADAARIDDLFYAILYVTGFFLLLVTVVLVAFIVRYRSRPGGRAFHTAGNTRLELIWAAVPAVLLLLIALASSAIWSQIRDDAPSEDGSFVVLVKPRQFQWDIVYSGTDGRFGTADDLEAINRLDVPAGRNVIVRLQAQDVVHSFFVPEFRLKQDAVPGMTTKIWFNVPEAGRYEIACAELCGLAHYRMRGVLVVHAPDEFEAWYRERMRSAVK